MRHGVAAIFVLVGLAGCASPGGGEAAAGHVAIDFESDDVGKTPAGFTTSLTGGGGPVSWVVREDPSAPSGKRVLVQESADDTSYRFPVCVYDKVVARDVAAEVKIKAISGEVDQVGGIALRYTPENYYVARAHAFNDNVVLFKIVRGNRIRLKEATVKVTPREWHSLRLSIKGTHLAVALDGHVVIELDDSTITGPGKVALWTKADSVTAFDDLSIEPARLEPEGPVRMPAVAAGPDLDAALERARSLTRATLLVVTDSGAPALDARVREILRDARVQARTAKLEVAELDLDLSRSRAAALRFHVTDAPALVSFSPGGRIVARDDKVESAETVLAHLDQAELAGTALDEALAALEAKIAAQPDDLDARRALASELLAHQSWREAMTHLQTLAHAERLDVPSRVGAWVDLARAHFAIGEPEKGRRSAKELLAQLGPGSPEARSAGNLLLGVRDGELGRVRLALEELD
jgi:hypothetical protein